MPASTYRTLPIRTLASGNQLLIPVYTFTGGPGPKVYIQANIHGPEVQGIPALYRLVELLEAEPELRGSVTIVPSINPVALDQKYNALQVGYVDPNEYVVGNFNRIYQMLTVAQAPAQPDPADPVKVDLAAFAAAHKDSPIEAIRADFKTALAAAADLRAKRGRTGLRFGLRLALTVHDLIADADLVIDLHTDGRAIYYGYTVRESVDTYRAFGVPHMILVDPDDFDGCFDEAFIIPWHRLWRALKTAGRELAFSDLGVEATTLELGDADAIDRARVEEDAARILSYLRLRGVLPGAPDYMDMPVYACAFKHRDNYYAEAGGLVYWHKQPGDEVRAGDVVATILVPATAHPEGKAVEVPMTVSQPGVLINLSRSQVMHQGIQVFSVLTNLQKL